tara:strand:+ start:529 stop:693 length:165 start_codon:yes stop_codon:yes gene_type:complete
MDWSVRSHSSSKTYNAFETKVVMKLEKIQEEMANINRILAKYDNMITEGLGEEE